MGNNIIPFTSLLDSTYNGGHWRSNTFGARNPSQSVTYAVIAIGASFYFTKAVDGPNPNTQFVGPYVDSLTASTQMNIQKTLDGF